MLKNQVEELGALQRAVFDQVKNNDQSKLREQLDVMVYWIRKDVARQVSAMMASCGRVEEAAIFTVGNIKIKPRALQHFYRYQMQMIDQVGKGLSESDRRQKWLDYVRWVETFITRQVEQHSHKFIKIKIRPGK